MFKVKDLTNWFFGQLTVIERAPNVKGRSMWKAQCSCGKVVIVSGSNLTQRRVKSCGHLRKEKGKAKAEAMRAAKAVLNAAKV